MLYNYHKTKWKINPIKPDIFHTIFNNALFIELVVQTPFVVMVWEARNTRYVPTEEGRETEGKTTSFEIKMHNNWWSINRNKYVFYLTVRAPVQYTIHSAYNFEWLDLNSRPSIVCVLIYTLLPAGDSFWTFCILLY